MGITHCYYRYHWLTLCGILACRLLSSWKPDTVVQIEQDLSHLTLDILGECIFGYNFGCIERPDNDLAAAIHRLVSFTDMNVLRLAMILSSGVSMMGSFALGENINLYSH